MTSKRKDIILSIAILVFALAFIICIPYQTVEDPILGARGYDILNGAFFPKISGALLLLSGVLLVVLAAMAKSKDDTERKPLFEKNEVSRLFFILALGFGYVKLVHLTNYPIATALLLGVMMVLTRARNWLVIIVYSVAAGLTIYYVFSRVFYIPLH